MPALLDLTGERFGRLTAHDLVTTTSSGHRMWRCLCDCGKEAVVRTGSLRSGTTRSCGCLFLEATAETGRNRRLPDPVAEDRGWETPCLIWQGNPMGTGYGTTWQGEKKMLAHRWMYEQTYGPIPDGLVIDHLCRVRLCVNPDHLEPVTDAENIRRGERVKLTAEDVRAIRASDATCEQLAARYGVAYATVNQARNGRKWKGI